MPPLSTKNEENIYPKRTQFTILRASIEQWRQYLKTFSKNIVKCQYKTSYIANFIHLGCGTQVFSHQGPVSWKRKQFFWGSRPGSGGNSFGTIQAVLLCTLFLLLLHQLHLRLSGIRSKRLGTPDVEHLLCFLPRTMILGVGWPGSNLACNRHGG